jgi:hypothetical protein
MATCDQPGGGWTVVLRRRPARVVEGRPEGGYTDAFEIICCDCGDHPDLDYSEVSPERQRSAGRTRSRPVLQHLRSTSGCTSSRQAPPVGTMTMTMLADWL